MRPRTPEAPLRPAAAAFSAWPRPAMAGVLLAPGIRLIEIAQAATPDAPARARRCAGAC